MILKDTARHGTGRSDLLCTGGRPITDFGVVFPGGSLGDGEVWLPFLGSFAVDV
jgi:hypothetical protein